MSKIIIGREYEREFESICALFEGGFLSTEVHIKKARGKVIETLAHTFEYSESEHGVNGGDGEARALTFTGEGASWFAPLRGEAFDSGNSDWKQLIMDVAADYHKRYSLIEFKQSKDKRALADEATLREKFKLGFIDRVFDDAYAYAISENRQTQPENYYAVSMRLEINGGGESAPLLGKIYFRETPDGDFLPITSREAGKIDKYIESAVPAEDDGEGDGIVDVVLAGRVLTGLEKSFKSTKFAQYVSFNEKYKAAINGMLAQLATSEVKTLECTNVKVLGISHVEWEKSVYDVTYRGRTALKFVVGLNGYITLQCVNCGGDALLIDGNVIKFKGDKVPAGCNTVLDFTAQNLGLIDEDIQAIKEQGEISDHLFMVNCPENPRNGNCYRVVCASQSVTFENGNRKCLGCRYPEIIYTDIFSDKAEAGKYTPTLHFAADSITLVDKATAKCKCCGREFDGSNLSKSGLCGFCRSRDTSPEAKALYRKYGNMLDLSTRLNHLSAPKYCMEDGNVIIFELGNDRYVFDKLNAKEYGFIKKPVKVNRGGRF